MKWKTPRFWYESSWISTLLSPIAWLYEFFLLSKNYRNKGAKYHPGIPVICVGNITVGGTGKTPIALALATELKQRGKNVHFITRGYSGNEEGPLQVDSRHTIEDVGDEALLLRTIAPVWVARNRRYAMALAKQAGAEILILDDGFQRRGELLFDLSFIVIDGLRGFGNQYVLPAGPLREQPTQALPHADAVIIVGEDQHDITSYITQYKSVLQAKFVPLDEEQVSGKSFIAFAGIGHPEKFFNSIEAAGGTLIDVYPFGDHYAYTEADLKNLQKEAEAQNATLITTEKDMVRIPSSYHNSIECFSISVEWKDHIAIRTWLDRACFPS